MTAPDYIIRSGGGSIVEPNSVPAEAEAAMVQWLDELERTRKDDTK